MPRGSRRKRSRKQTEFFAPEKQQQQQQRGGGDSLARTEKRGNNNRTPPPNRNRRSSTCSAEVPPSSSSGSGSGSGSSTEPEACRGRDCGGSVTSSLKKRRSLGPTETRKANGLVVEGAVGLDTPLYVDVERGSTIEASDSESDDGDDREERSLCSGVDSPRSMLDVEAAEKGEGDDIEGMGRGASSRHHNKPRHPGSISQVMGEDIILDAGLVFLPPAFDLDDDYIGRVDTMLHKYGDLPGVKCHQKAQPPAKKSRRGGGSRGANGLSVSGSGNAASASVLFRSRTTYEGASINLGSHPTSAAAAATQDLANLAILGSEHSKTMQILSTDEAWVGLRAARLSTALPAHGRVETFRSQFTEQYKHCFEHQIEEALASIGGQDDVLADVLSTLDLESYRQAEMIDTAEEATRAKARKEEEKRRRAREARRVKKLGKQMSEEKPPRKSDNHPINEPINYPSLRGEHGIYGVDDGGRYFWLPGGAKTTRRDGSEEAAQQSPSEGKTSRGVPGVLEADSDTSPNSQGNRASSEKQARHSSAPVGIDVPAAGSKTARRPSPESGSSPILSEQQERGRKRILSFDSCPSSVDAAAGKKDRSMESAKEVESPWALRDVVPPEEVQEASSSSLGNALKQRSAAATREKSTAASAEPQQVTVVPPSGRIFEPNLENNALVSIRESRVGGGESKELDSSEAASNIPEAITITKTTKQALGPSRAEAESGHLPPSLVSSESIASEHAVGTLLSSIKAKNNIQNIGAKSKESGRRDSAPKQNAAIGPLPGKDDGHSLMPLLSKNGEVDLCGNEGLRPALEILQNFTITPLLSSHASGGVRVAGSANATGKLLTGLKFQSKVIGQPDALQPVDLTYQEFVIDVSVGEGNVPVLKLRAEPSVVSEISEKR